MNKKYAIKPYSRSQSTPKRRTRRQRRGQREMAIARRLRQRRYKCAHCGAKVLLDVKRKSSRIKRDRCGECGSTFLQPDSDAALQDFISRGRRARIRAGKRI